MKKRSKKKAKTKAKSKPEAIANFEEIEFVCSNCGKHVKMIKLKGYSTEGLLCQRCSLGEELPDED